MPLQDRRLGQKVEKDHIVLASSFYPDDKDEHGDFCVLPKGMVTKVSLIKHEDQQLQMSTKPES